MATFHKNKKGQKKWEARRRVTLPDSTKSRKSFWGETEEAAEAMADAYVNALPKRPIDISTFGGFAINVYLPTVADLSYKWKSQIAQILNNHSLPKWGNTPLKEINRHMLQVWLNSKARTLSRSQVGHIRKVTGAVLTLAEIDGAIPSNPMRHVKIVGRETQGKGVWSPHELAAMFHAAAGTVMQGPILFGGFTGMRLGEIDGAYAESITPDSIVVCRQAQIQNGKVRIIERTKTEGSSRTIPLPAGFYSIFASIERPPSKMACPNSEGNVLRPDNATRELRTVCKRAGVPYHGFHRLRASFISAMENLGCPRGLLREIVGHSRGSVTDLYIEGSDEIKRMYLGMLLSALETPVYLNGRPEGGRIDLEDGEGRVVN